MLGGEEIELTTIFRFSLEAVPALSWHVRSHNIHNACTCKWFLWLFVSMHNLYRDAWPTLTQTKMCSIRFDCERGKSDIRILVTRRRRRRRRWRRMSKEGKMRQQFLRLTLSSLFPAPLMSFTPTPWNGMSDGRDDELPRKWDTSALGSGQTGNEKVEGKWRLGKCNID